MGSGVGLVLYLVLVLAFLYACYFVIRKGVAHGIRDARRAEADERNRIP